MKTDILVVAYPQSRSSQFPKLWQWGDTREYKRNHGQGSWHELAKGIFQTTEHQYINWREFFGIHTLLLRDRLGIDQSAKQLYCASLVLIVFYFSLSLFHTDYDCYWYYFFLYLNYLIILISTHRFYSFFTILLPIPLEWGVCNTQFLFGLF